MDVDNLFRIAYFRSHPDSVSQAKKQQTQPIDPEGNREIQERRDHITNYSR
jgi:hypothetical protein